MKFRATGKSFYGVFPVVCVAFYDNELIFSW
jgi:hypothetical protein